MSQGAFITLVLSGGIIFMMWFNAMIRRRIYRRYLEEQAMAQSMMPGFWNAFGRGASHDGRYMNSSYDQRGSILVLFAIFGLTVYGLSQFKANYFDSQNGNGEHIAQDLMADNTATEINLKGSKPSEKNEPDEYSPLDAPRKTGEYRSQLVQTSSSQQYGAGYESAEGLPEDNSMELAANTGQQPNENEVLSGFGKQLFAVSDEKGAIEQLLKVKEIYREAEVFLIAEHTPDGRPQFKGVVGMFPDRNTAKTAYPQLNRHYPGNFPISLEGLYIEE